MKIIKDEWIRPYKLAEAIANFEPLMTPNTDDPLGEFLEYHFSTIHSAVDPAISEKETADFWAEVTIGLTKRCPICPGTPAGHVVILDYTQVREDDPLKQVEHVISNFELWQPDKIRLETVAFQAGLVKLVRREAAAQGLHLPLRGFKPLTSKVRRANIHAANFSGGIVHVREDHPLYQTFVDEVTEFPQAEHDDLFDAYMSATDVSLKRRRGVGTKDDDN